MMRWLLIGCLMLSGCSLVPSNPRYTIASLTVIYADAQTIDRMATLRGYGGPFRIEGFYDPLRKELWCPDGDDVVSLRVCGHELRHVVRGQFH